MRITMMAAGAAVLMAGSPALAQQASSDVNSYLCTFAGKCGETSTTESPTPTMAAPPTKGFRLAASSPTVAAPPTKGFRLANGAPTASVPAPQTRSFRVVRTPAPAVAAATPMARPVARRAAMTPAPRPAMSAGARADLMLTFEYNSDQMTPAALARARSFAQALQMDELRAKRFLIEGHTDARGSRDANIDLSRRRAQTVADFLVSQGVERGRVEVKGVGPDQPLPGRSAAAEANRRVEAVLLS